MYHMRQDDPLFVFFCAFLNYGEWLIMTSQYKYKTKILFYNFNIRLSYSEQMFLHNFFGQYYTDIWD